MVNKILTEHRRKSKKNKQTNEKLKSQVPKSQKLRQELKQIMNISCMFPKLGIELDQ